MKVQRVVFSLAAAVVAVVLFSTPQNAFGQSRSYSRSGPWWAKLPRPMFSMAYTPEPSDYGPQFTCRFPDGCKYFDSDFYNTDFRLLWGAGGRDDLKTLGATVHANNLHLYDWSTCRDHVPFLDYANANGLTIWVPFSNFNVENPLERRLNIEDIFREIYGLDQNNNGRKTPNPAVVIWGVGNEFDINQFAPRNVAQVVRIVVDMENAAGITDANKLVFTSPVSFAALRGRPAAIQQILELQAAFIDAGLTDIWYTRFMASTATTNPGSDLQEYITNTFPAWGDFSAGDGLALFLSEYGANGQDACKNLHPDNKPLCEQPNQQVLRDESQRDFDAAAFAVGVALAKSAPNSKTGYFYGFSVFQWQDAFWKCPGGQCINTETQFGIQKRGSPSGRSYRRRAVHDSGDHL